jgi:uncharacterized protein YndB with AHSA1/START domain
MVNVITKTTISSSIEKVFEYAADPSNAPEWYVNIDAAEWQTEEIVEKGSRIAFKASFLGRKLAYVYEIVEFEPGHKMIMRTVDGPFPMETTYIWKALNANSTVMTLQNSGEPKGFSKIFSPFVAPMMKIANKKDLRRIKKILENSNLE